MEGHLSIWKAGSLHQGFFIKCLHLLLVLIAPFNWMSDTHVALNRVHMDVQSLWMRRSFAKSDIINIWRRYFSEEVLMQDSYYWGITTCFDDDDHDDSLFSQCNWCFPFSIRRWEQFGLTTDLRTFKICLFFQIGRSVLPCLGGPSEWARQNTIEICWINLI